ncbi:N-formylglutamate amidohydrolase [Hoeflea poritis]|uniref:N-formylglutamate amidohydrolase n=1 Tax=Hoeflea poritis TaxID=2993659 RepID=A0ABT4VPF5_9HYPH|nr:N-formylglutamate amidohydrolase [Hoeflea poritis]MDA4846597.1 N-formylglutamate amidohydrolase [Hoeflea poritis]
MVVKNYFQMLLDEPNALTPDQVVAVLNEHGDHGVILVCEHASNWIPALYDGLGVDTLAQHSHIAWDPGALGVAEALSSALNAPLVFGCVSRLVYDCNRPPEAQDAIPAVSEVTPVPGNRDLTAEDRTERIDTVYMPFRRRLEKVVGNAPSNATLVTIHSFTPTYHGQKRSTEIGVLHGSDPRLAEAMMATAGQFTQRTVRLNDPYGPQDGVSHTLNLHGSANGLANVMIEIRNDLIDTRHKQNKMAKLLHPWLRAAIAGLSPEAAP